MMTISQYSHLSCTVLYLTLSYDSLEVLRYSEGMFDLPSVFIVFSVSTQSFSWSHVSTHYYLFFFAMFYFFPNFIPFSPPQYLSCTFLFGCFFLLFFSYLRFFYFSLPSLSLSFRLNALCCCSLADCQACRPKV